jgi:hypothetical protein
MSPFATKTQPSASEVNLLEFVDQQFPNLPIEDINSTLIKERIFTLCLEAAFAGAILRMLKIALDLEFDGSKFQIMLKRVIALGSAEEKKQAYLIATEFNERNIYDRFKQVPGNRVRPNRGHETTPTPKKAHQPLCDKFSKHHN